MASAQRGLDNRIVRAVLAAVEARDAFLRGVAESNKAKKTVMAMRSKSILAQASIVQMNEDMSSSARSISSGVEQSKTKRSNALSLTAKSKTYNSESSLREMARGLKKMAVKKPPF